jgi:hypothetical protein
MCDGILNVWLVYWPGFCFREIAVAAFLFFFYDIAGINCNIMFCKDWIRELYNWLSFHFCLNKY